MLEGIKGGQGSKDKREIRERTEREIDIGLSDGSRGKFGFWLWLSR